MPAQKGNRYAQEWNLENALPRFEDALKFSEEDDKCLCIQDAIFITGIPSRTFYYLAENHEVLQIIKEDIASNIIRRVNKNSLKGEYRDAPAIWRMKQLGEKDESHLDLKSGGQEIKGTTIIVQDQQTVKEIKKLNEND
jgi:sulfur transfer complex TusBCD TusB component (DsrH family)